MSSPTGIVMEPAIDSCAACAARSRWPGFVAGATARMNPVIRTRSPSCTAGIEPRMKTRTRPEARALALSPSNCSIRTIM